MKRSYKAIAALLLMGMLLPLAACAGDDAKTTDTTAAPAVGSDAVTTEPVPEVDPNDPQLEAVDYGGDSFDILYNGNDLEPNKDFDAAEITGEPLNDAIYKRNKAIEDKYKVVIAAEYMTDANIQSAVQKSVNANDGNYDLLEANLNYSLQMGANGLLTELRDIPVIDLDKPYWSSIALKGASINNKNYFVYSDANIHAFGATPCILFNKQVHEDYKLEDLYKLVEEGKWTMDKMSEMVVQIAGDHDGDGDMDKDDRWGLIANNFCVDCLISGTGYSMITKDENDLPVLNFNTEQFYNILEKMKQLCAVENGSFIVDRTSTATEAREYWTEYAITENRALFWIGNLKCVERLRSMETDFGIVPMPKYDESQENYAIHCQANIGAAMSVPAIVKDIEMVGTILEDIAWMSSQTVLPTYYDIVLEGRNFRDPESIVTLNIMRDTLYCDLGFMTSSYGIAILTQCRTIITNNGLAASTLSKVTKVYEKQLDRLTTSFTAE